MTTSLTGVAIRLRFQGTIAAGLAGSAIVLCGLLGAFASEVEPSVDQGLRCGVENESDEDWEVIKGVLKEDLFDDLPAAGNPGAMVVLLGDSDSTVVEDVKNLPASALREVPLELNTALREANRDGRSWPTVIDVPHITVSKPGEYPSTASDVKWKEIKIRFKDAVAAISVSRPGFSRDKMSALLLVKNGVGELTGGGCLVVMNRSDNGWKLGKIVATWVH